MNTSTEQVTLAAAFVSDILDLYKGNPTDYSQLLQMASGLDLTNPMNQVPMQVYNDMCNWIESQIGEVNTRKVGRKIGNTAFQAMVSYKMISEKPTPLEAMKALALVASTMIQDPHKRGWEIIEQGPKHIVMRRTQTFNSTLQFGLLDEIIRKTGVNLPKVEYLKSVKAGDKFDDYKVSWI